MRRAHLTLILLAAFGLRMINIQARTLWYDEAFAVLFSEKGLTAMLYGTLTPVNGAAADVHPLLYYSLLDGWMQLVGQSPFAVRLLSVLFSLLTLSVLYALIRDLFGWRTARAALIVAAVVPFAVQYAQEARMYALLGLLLMAATWCYVRATRDEKPGGPKFIWWIGFAVCAALSMYTQQLAAFYLIALGVAALLSGQRARIVRMIAAAGGALILYSPWLINLPSQLGRLGAYWISKPGLAELLLTARSFAFVDIDVLNIVALLVSLIAAVLFGLFVIYRAIPVLRRPNGDRDALVLVLWLTVVPIALMWLASQIQPVYLNRALFPSALMAYAAVGWLLTRARLPSPIRTILGIVGGASALAGLIAFYTWTTFPRPPFDRADAFLEAQRQNGDRIIHANKITALSMVYYDRGLSQQYVRDVPGSGEDTLAPPTQKVLDLPADACIAAAVHGATRVWYVIFTRQSPNDLPWLDAHYRRESITAFNDLNVYLYDQPDATAQRAACPS